MLDTIKLVKYLLMIKRIIKNGKVVLFFIGSGVGYYYIYYILGSKYSQKLHSRTVLQDHQLELLRELNQKVDQLSTKSDIITKRLDDLEEVVKNLGKGANKFISDFNFDDYYSYLDTLTSLQVVGIINILIFILLLIIILENLFIFFGNEIIKYLELERKYPRFAKFIQLRAKFQRYYLLWNIFLMFVVCFYGIFVNLLAFY